MSVSTAVDASARASVVGIKTTFKDLRAGKISYLPQRVGLIGQGSTAATYATTKRVVTSALEVGQLYGFGSPVHLATRNLLPANGDGIGSIPLTIYPLTDDGAGVAAAGDITPSGTQTVAANYIVRFNGSIDSEAFTIAVADSVATIVTAMTAAINAAVNVPMLATDSTTKVDLASKWKGASANDITVEIVGSTTAGTSFAFTQPVNGATNPDTDTATDQIGDIWETMILNCLGIGDTTTLGKLTTWGEPRWGALVRKPPIVFTGNTITTQALATVVSDARPTDRTNAQLVAPGSPELPFMVAARELSRIVVVANNNPAHDYGAQPATGLVPGLDSEQWLYNDRDLALKNGSSTIVVKDAVITLGDTVTFYHPSGDEDPAYRYVADIVKLQNVIYNIDNIFTAAAWQGAPLLPDGQPTTNKSAKKPSAAVAAIAEVLDSLGLEAIISDPATAKKSIVAAINSSFPKRLDISLTIQLSGNTNIISIDLDFGFYFGITPIAA